ncbi:MAG: sigma-70 family RNA polymerase sigma factor [Deltaproteobacteria bacterium]|nr:MAG: sigma-70 family RNA polymerase sigma factor [Deltaproteobacteria bacterium]
MSEERFREKSDEELVRDAVRKDEEAFSELVRRYQNRAVAVAVGIVGNRDDALDVVQEAFLKAYRSLRNFHFDSKFYTWFYRILVNQAIDRVRESSRRGVSFDETWMKEDGEAGLPRSDYRTPPDEAAERKEMSAVIKEAIESLPEHHRTVIVLREIEGLRYEEIAAVMGISIGTVMSRLHYARERLREKLSGYVRGER